jgi:DNA-binding MarR family transcriptional regulator
MQKLHGTASEVANAHDLHTSEMFLIDTLGKYGSLPMRELAALSFSSPANATYTVRSLKKSFLRRQRSDDSQRVVNVSLSSKGEKMFKLTYPQTTEAVNNLISSGLTKQERKTLDKLIQKLLD